MDKNKKKVMLFLETSRGFGRGLLAGIAKYSHIHGPWIFYRQLPWEPNEFESLQNWGGNGIIAHTDSPKQVKQILALNVPTILCANEPVQGNNIHYISSENISISKLLVDYFIRLGYRNLAFYGHHRQESLAMARYTEVREYICKKGLENSFYTWVPKRLPRSWQQRQQMVAEWVKKLPKPIGLIAYNDDHGQHILDACTIAKTKVPEEVAVLGVDNDELECDLSNPPLSSLALNAEKAGYEAASLLDRLMEGENIPPQTILAEPLEIVSRRSTDIMAVADKDIVVALRFIHDHSKEMFQVDDVVNATTLSRRSLANRFMQFVGHSIHDEIKRVRIEHISKMLVRTDMTITQIALHLGFSSSENISRYFYKATGITPLAYRRKNGYFKLPEFQSEAQLIGLPQKTSVGVR